MSVIARFQDICQQEKKPLRGPSLNYITVRLQLMHCTAKSGSESREREDVVG